MRSKERTHVLIITGDSESTDARQFEVLHPSGCAIDVFATNRPQKFGHVDGPHVEILYRCGVQFEIDNVGFARIDAEGALPAGVYMLDIDYYTIGGGFGGPVEHDSDVSVTRLVEEELEATL